MIAGIHSMGADQYFASAGVSRSMLEALFPKKKKASGTPKHFWAQHIAKTVTVEETDSMRLGTWQHRAMLEPETMDGAFYVQPDTLFIKPERLKKLTSAVVIGEPREDGQIEIEWNGRLGEADAWIKEHGDRPTISAGEGRALIGMRDAVMNHKVARNLIEGAQTERCLFANDSHGTLRKARLDLIPRAGNALPDLKTCVSAAPDEIEAAIDRLGYNRQAAFTLELCKLLGMPFEHWLLICVESAPPHDVVVYPIDELAIRVGRNEIEGAIQTYRNCLATGRWPGRCEGLADPISLPSWRAKELEQA